MAQQQVEEAQDFGGKIIHIRVTRDESWVSVGGMLSLDQFLRILGHVGHIFGTLTGYRRRSRIQNGDRGISAPFWDFLDLGLCNGHGDLDPSIYPCLGLIL
jgi:hypothetical protein